jgi:tetratricopeptide (TPR) repeat protein
VAAESETFANRYAAADERYVPLLTVAPRSAQLHAAYALFLQYRGDAGDALAEAQQAVSLDPHSSAAEASLCRVRDWAGDLSAAAAAGRAAVALDGENPLAHLFYAEALADSGDLGAAQAQIDAAAPLIAASPTPYLQAEARRETANLDADSGNQSAQIAALQQAVALQPAWLYRTEELVGAQFGAHQEAAARQTLDAAATPLPEDADALKGLGQEAMMIGDAAVATAAWNEAGRLDPSDATILDTIAELQVAANRDVNAAVTAFEHSLTMHPGDVDAAAYLTALARFLQGGPALAQHEITAALAANRNSGTLRAPPSPDVGKAAADAAAQALTVVNSVRAQAGLPAVHLDDRLTASATSHSFYWLFNNLSPSVVGLGIHEETSGLPGYSGVDTGARALAFGYPTGRSAEDITHRDGASAAVHDWVDSVYHRFPILRPDLEAIGYAQARVGLTTIQDMEFGYSAPVTAAPVRFPAPGQANVPVRFVDNELPDPVPAGSARTTGYPITVTFASGSSVALRSFTVTGPDGRTLDAYVLSPGAATENSASLLPAHPLLPATAYTARIDATVNGGAYTETWTFTTAS